jgi:hypothetical protein
MESLFSISPPDNFDFSDFGNWPNWIRRFERFRIAAGLNEKDQVNSLVYTMGEKADDILCTLGLNGADQKKYIVVRNAFEKYLICKHNVIYQRAQFNKRCQEPGETDEYFISAVYKLAEHCQYGTLHEEMIRDRLVVGLRHNGLSEKLHMDCELTQQKLS